MRQRTSKPARSMSALVQIFDTQANVLKDWGLDKLAQQMRDEMDEELQYSNRFIERIIFLKGSPEIEMEKAPQRAKSLVELFSVDLADEEEAIAFYTAASREANDEGDIGSRTLFEQIVLDEENHQSWLEL